ncbi:MAG TPA: beta-propeller fold lactonase family protein, partial [Edaphobacter sp.]
INSDGTLTAKNNGAVASVASLDISPDGQWLFGLDQFQNMLDEYKIDSTSGALSLQDNPVYTLGDGETATPKMVKVAPTGNYVFAALGTGGEVVFTLNTTSGAVAQVQHLSVGSVQTNDNALAVDSTTAHLYIARSGNNGGIAVYTVGANGVLNSISGSPFAAGGQPYSLTMDTSGKYLYAANRTDGTISGYTIGTDAGLTALANSPFSSGSLVGSLAVDSSGLYLFAGSEGGSPDLGMFSFDTTALGQINLIKSITTDTATSPAGVIAVAATH